MTDGSTPWLRLCATPEVRNAALRPELNHAQLREWLHARVRATRKQILPTTPDAMRSHFHSFDYGRNDFDQPLRYPAGRCGVVRQVWPGGVELDELRSAFEGLSASGAFSFAGDPRTFRAQIPLTLCASVRV